MLTVVPDGCPGHEGGKDRSPSLIGEIVREGARRMLAEALAAEVDAYIARFAAERGEDGRHLVVRNGYHQSREVLTSAGAIEVTVPRVNGKRTDAATGELDQLLAFYDYPCEHWVHLRTTSPIESTFATIRHRSKITKGPGSRAAGLAMAFELIEAVQDRWRAVNAPHLVALVRAGASFERGVLAGRHDQQGRAA